MTGDRVPSPSAPAILGVIHLPPLPGSPFFEKEFFRQGLRDSEASLQALIDGGAQGALVQTADRVYDLLSGVDPIRVAVLTKIMVRFNSLCPTTFELGVQVMRNAVEESLAVAVVAGCRFTRATALIGATLSPSGWVQPNAAAIMAYRRKIGAEDVRIYADVASIHNSWDVDNLPKVAERAVGAGADGVVIGLPDVSLSVAHLRAVRSSNPDAFVVLAGHATFTNAQTLLPLVDAAFVSTALTPGGWGGRIDAALVSQFVSLASEVHSA